VQYRSMADRWGASGAGWRCNRATAASAARAQGFDHFRALRLFGREFVFGRVGCGFLELELQLVEKLPIDAGQQIGSLTGIPFFLATVPSYRA
jgi:hypothetical protein